MSNNKNLSPKLLNKYLRDTLENEYNLRYDERTMFKILDGIKVGIDKLVEDCYSFKLFGFKFEVYHKSPRVYRNILNGEIEVSKPHYSLRVKVPRTYQRELKLKTRYDSDEKPVLMAVSEEEAKGL